MAPINCVAGTNTGKVQVCSVLRGAKACSAPPQDLFLPGEGFGAPNVLINGTNVYVIVQRYVANVDLGRRRPLQRAGDASI